MIHDQIIEMTVLCREVFTSDTLEGHAIKDLTVIVIICIGFRRLPSEQVIEFLRDANTRLSGYTE